MHSKERYKMTPQEIQTALASGMAFDAVMARHATDIQREQGIDMGLSMARARTDVQNIQNQRDEAIDPAPFASPVAPIIGAQDIALKPLEKALTYNFPTAAVAPLKAGTPLGSLGIQGQTLPIDFQQDALMDMTAGMTLTPEQKYAAKYGDPSAYNVTGGNLIDQNAAAMAALPLVPTVNQPLIMGNAGSYDRLKKLGFRFNQL